MNEERRKTDRRVPPAVVEFAVEERQQLLEKIADQAREIERLKRAAQTNWNEFAEGMKAQPSGVVLPEELFDGHGVYSGLSHYAKMRTSPENVSDVLDRLVAMMRARLNSSPVSAGEPFQSRVLPWLLECFGETIASDVVERNHRFLEEALELVQACGCPAGEAHKLVDYVYGRPVGEKSQEVGGVMVTLAALCLAQGLDMHQAGETELARITHPAMVERIRDKQKRKPAMSPLPGVYPERESASAGGVDERAALILAANRLDRLVLEVQGGDWRGTVSEWAAEARAALTASAPNHSEQVREGFLNRAVTHYEAALQAAFPSGSSGQVFSQWNEARRIIAAAPSAGSQRGDV